MPVRMLEATTVQRVNPAFGDAVRRLLESHGLSLRAARIRTGIDHVTLSDMAAGYVPRVEQVEKLARGFGLDVNQWRELAGYPRVEGDPSPESVLADLGALSDELPPDVPRVTREPDPESVEVRAHTGLDRLSPADQRVYVEIMSAYLRAKNRERGLED